VSRSNLVMAGGALIALLVLHTIWAGISGQRQQKWETERTALLAQGQILDSLAQTSARHAARETQRADSLIALARAKERAAQSYQARTRQTERVADSLKSVLKHTTDSIPVLVALVETQDSVIGSLQAETRVLRLSLAGYSEATAILRAVVDSQRQQLTSDSARIKDLESLVRRAPTSPPKLLGILPMPSRTVVLVAGAVAGYLVHAKTQ